MLSPFGTGITWIREDLISKVNPSFAPWWGDVDWQNMMHHDYEPQSAGMKYQATVNPEIFAFGETLEMIMSIGLNAIGSEIQGLHQHLQVRVEESKGIEVAGNFPAINAGAIRQIRLQDPKIDVKRVVQRLREQRIAVSMRMGRIRVSPHFYNSKSEIDRLVDAILQATNEKE